MSGAVAEIGYKPLEWTRASGYDTSTGMFEHDRPGFHFSPARFRIVVGGRRVGKSEAAAPEMLGKATAVADSVNWWVSPTYKICRVGWRKLKAIVPPEIVKDESKTDMYMLLKNGSEIEFRSAELEDNLRSEGLNFVVCDELAMWKKSVFEAAIWPALVDKKGGMVGITTPKGRNFLFRLFLRGADPAYPLWDSWTFPTHANTSLNPEDIEEMTRGMNELVYRQEILAEFVADAGGVFRNVRENVREGLPLKGPEPGRVYFIGVDWGKRRDFSVFVVLDVTETPRKVVAYKRFSKIDYGFQLAQLGGLARMWRPLKIKAEQNSVGDALIDNLRRDLPGFWVEGVVVAGGRDGGSKNRMVEKLSMSVENGEIVYPDWPELLAELEIYEYQRTAGGNVRYAAPAGYHDDCVMAAAIADSEDEYVEPKVSFV